MLEEIRPEVWVSWLAQEFIASIVTKDSRVFEWGSGGSTLWFAEHAASVMSLEHSPQWGGEVAKELERRQVDNCILKITRDLGQYVNEVFTDDTVYDFIMVDGPSQARHGCTDAAITKLKPGGWLVVDNTERPFAVPIHKMLRDWDSVTIRGNGPRHETSRYKIQTTFWKKR